MFGVGWYDASSVQMYETQTCMKLRYLLMAIYLSIYLLTHHFGTQIFCINSLWFLESLGP